MKLFAIALIATAALAGAAQAGNQAGNLWTDKDRAEFLAVQRGGPYPGAGYTNTQPTASIGVTAPRPADHWLAHHGGTGRNVPSGHQGK